MLLNPHTHSTVTFQPQGFVFWAERRGQGRMSPFLLLTRIVILHGRAQPAATLLAPIRGRVRRLAADWLEC